MVAQAHDELNYVRIVSPTPHERPVPVAPVPISRAPSRLRLYGIVGSLVVLLTLWMWLFYAEGAFRGGPNGQSFGADYAMFITAARLIQAGDNPYDHTRLYNSERTYLNSQGIPILKKSAIVRVGNPPLLFFAMQPLTRFPFQASAWGWMVALYLLSGIAFVALLKSMGWKRLALPAFIFLAMPQSVFGAFYGNTVVLVFTGLCFALAFARRYPYLAGLCLTVAWLKPPTALPIALLIVLFHVEQRRRVATGFGVATVALMGIMLATCGVQSLPHWLHGLADYSADMGLSPDVASFAGMYVRSVPHSLRLVIEGFSLSVALIFTALAWHRYRSVSRVPPLAVGWLWVLWFLATPYAHFYDEVLLAFPLLLLAGIDGRWIVRSRPALAIFLALLSLVVISAAPFNVQLLWLPLVAIMLCLFTAAREPRYLAA